MEGQLKAKQYEAFDPTPPVKNNGFYQPDPEFYL